MIVGEAEARTKYCVDWATAPASEPPRMCQGSKCMAWHTTHIRMNAVGTDAILGGYCGKSQPDRTPR